MDRHLICSKRHLAGSEQIYMYIYVIYTCAITPEVKLDMSCGVFKLLCLNRLISLGEKLPVTTVESGPPGNFLFLWIQNQLL